MKPTDHTPKKPRPSMWDEKDEGVKRRSLRNEARLAEEIGFRTTPGSGNTPWPNAKGDGEHPLFVFEVKETIGTSIGISGPVIVKLMNEAAPLGKDPAFVFTLHGLPENLPKDWVTIPAPLFTEMLRIWEKFR